MCHSQQSFQAMPPSSQASAAILLRSCKAARIHQIHTPRMESNGHTTGDLREEEADTLGPGQSAIPWNPLGQTVHGTLRTSYRGRSTVTVKSPVSDVWTVRLSKMETTLGLCSISHWLTSFQRAHVSEGPRNAVYSCPLSGPVPYNTPCECNTKFQNLTETTPHTATLTRALLSQGGGGGEGGGEPNDRHLKHKQR